MASGCNQTIKNNRIDVMVINSFALPPWLFGCVHTHPMPHHFLVHKLGRKVVSVVFLLVQLLSLVAFAVFRSNSGSLICLFLTCLTSIFENQKALRLGSHVWLKLIRLLFK